MARGRTRKTVGGKVRPTTQKLLESLTAILLPRIEGALVLDLFAGTGRVGLRMLEEGAESVVFVEAHRRVAQDLRQTLREDAIRDHCSLVVSPVPQALVKVRGVFDLILCDPPYDWDKPNTLLPRSHHLCKPGGLLVVEHHHKTSYEATSGWTLHRREKFGETRLSFFESLGPAQHPS